MAIAFDAATDGGNATGTSLTFSHTCTGSDRALWLGVMGNQAVDVVTGATYNGVSLTLADKLRGLELSFNRWLYLFYLLSPASGSNTVAITATASTFIGACAASYTGVGTFESALNNEVASPATSLTTSLTTSADNAWTILAENSYTGNNPPGAGTGSTRRVFDVMFGGLGLFDSGGAITPAGSYSMETTRPSNAAIMHVMAAMAPAGAPPVLALPNQMVIQL